MSQITQIKEDAVPSTCCRDHKSRSPTTAPFGRVNPWSKVRIQSSDTSILQALGRVKQGWAPRNAPMGLVEPLLASLNNCMEKKVTFKSKKLSLLST